MNYEKAVANIRKELKKYIVENNIKSLVIGISGGMDSCLCAALAKPVCDELNIPFIGRSLPASSNQPDEIERANLTGKTFCTNFSEHSIEEEYNFMRPRLQSNMIFHAPNPEGSATRIHNGNLKARLRMIHLYDIASSNQGMVISTDNYTELMLGFWTLHGDVGDYGMIQNLYKSEVYDMAEWVMNNEYDIKGEIRSDAYYSIKRTIQALATDGLGVTNLGDLGQIMPEWTGSSRDGYKEVDRILKIWETPNKNMVIDKTTKVIDFKDHPVVQRHLRTQFKRNNPVNIHRNLIIE
jgi:nicotinamide-nucleotide amidase